MILISPILGKEIEKSLSEYLRDDFLTQRFGEVRIFASDAGGPFPIYKISPREAEGIIRPSNEDGAFVDLSASNEARAWRFTFSGSHSLSVLYGLSSKYEAPKLMDAQLKAAITAIKELSALIFGDVLRTGYLGCSLLGAKEDRPHELFESLRARSHEFAEDSQCISFLFTSGATEDQCPHLQTTAFMINELRDKKNSLRPALTPELVKEVSSHLTEAYSGALDHFTCEAIGPFHRVRGSEELRIVGVPQELVRKFFFDSSFHRGGQNDPNEKPLRNDELFAKWHRQAQDFGWGPEKASALLREINRAKFWEKVRSNWTPKAFLQRYLPHAIKKPGPKQPKQEKPSNQTKQKDNGHSQSH